MKDITGFDPKIIQNLPPQDCAARLMVLPAKERLERLLERRDAHTVIQAMPEQDFYLFIKEIDRDNASILLAPARIEQINYLLDFEGWQRDHIKAGAMLSWLESILIANNQKFLEWLYKVDFELLVALFKKWLHVEILPEDTEYSEVQDSFPAETLDDQFYFSIRYPQHKDLIKSVLSFLFETHHNFYRELFNHVLWSTESEVEELAYQFHQGRLADHAIPDGDEASSIYQLFVSSKLPETKIYPEEQEVLQPIPIFALMPLARNSLLTDAMAMIESHQVRRSLQMEFTALSNKIIVADNLAIVDPENLRFAADKSCAMVNLALDEYSKGDLNLAFQALTKNYLEELFRFGQTKISALCHCLAELGKTGWVSHWPLGHSVLDPPWYDRVSLLQASTPQIYKKGPPESSEREDFIRSSGDLIEAERVVHFLQQLSPIFSSLQNTSKQSWQEIGHSLWHRAQVNSLEAMTMGGLLLTAATNTLWHGSWTPEPLSHKLWPEIRPLLSNEKMQMVFQQLCQKHPDPDGLYQTVFEYVDPLQHEFFQELQNRKNSAHLIPFLLFTDS